jgi:hypothetical protein
MNAGSLQQRNIRMLLCRTHTGIAMKMLHVCKKYPTIVKCDKYQVHEVFQKMDLNYKRLTLKKRHHRIFSRSSEKSTNKNTITESIEYPSSNFPIVKSIILENKTETAIYHLTISWSTTTPAGSIAALDGETKLPKRGHFW